MSGEKVVIGNATLYHADCREVLPTLPKVDSVITSPPYNCGKDYGEGGDDKEIEEFKQFLRDTVFAADCRVKVVNVGQFIGSRSGRVLFRDVLLACTKEPLIDEVIWDKGPANGAAWGNYPNSPRIRAQHESIYVFGDARMPSGNGLDWASWSRLTTSIWQVSPKVDLKTHPAMMPVEVASRCASLWSDKFGEVLDPFMGSGTTGVACVQLGRAFTGIERERKYFDIACERISRAQAQGALFPHGTPAAPVQIGFDLEAEA